MFDFGEKLYMNPEANEIYLRHTAGLAASDDIHLTDGGIYVGRFIREFDGPLKTSTGDVQVKFIQLGLEFYPKPLFVLANEVASSRQERAVDTMKEKLGEASHKLSDAAESAKEKLSDVAESATEKLSEGVEWLKGKFKK